MSSIPYVFSGAHQILHATSFIELCNVEVVRRAFPCGDQIDQEDRGGDDQLGKHHNKAELRTRRSFELLMRSKHAVRFEVGCMPLQLLSDFNSNRHTLAVLHKNGLIV